MSRLRGTCLSALTALVAACEGRDAAPAPGVWLSEPISVFPASISTGYSSPGSRP